MITKIKNNTGNIIIILGVLIMVGFSFMIYKSDDHNLKLEKIQKEFIAKGVKIK